MSLTDESQRTLSSKMAPAVRVDDVLELASLEDVENTLCDLLLFPEARGVTELDFDDIVCGTTSSTSARFPTPDMSFNNSETGSITATMTEAFANILNLTASEAADAAVRCTAGDQVLAVLLSKYSL